MSILPFNITNPGFYISGIPTSQEAAFLTNLTGLSYATGDILYYDGSNLNRLPIGTAAQVLSVSGGIPSWTSAAGYTNLTQFVDQTAWRVFYSNTSGDVTELALGANGTYLMSNGASSAPTWATPAGSGDVSKVGTPVDNQIGVWTGDGTLEGDTALTFDTTTDTLTIAASGNLAFGAETILDDNAGTMTLSNIDALDATTKATIESAIRDSNNNLTVNNYIEGFTTTATAAGTTTLTVTSTETQYFTGTTTQTVVLPVTSTLTLGQRFKIFNLSTGLVTVQSSGANNVVILAANTSVEVVCILTSGTTAASWDVTSTYNAVSVATGKKLTVSNSITFAGTDSTTMTFPTTTATIARTDAAQTFTGVQTMTSPSIVTSIVTSSATFSAFNTTATTLSIGGAATTLTLGGTSTATITHNLSTNATASANTKTVNLGTGGAAGSTTNINIGSSVAGTTTVNSPNISLGGITGVTTTGSIELGHASDTTIARASAGVASIEGNNIVVNTSSPTLATITTTGNIELGHASDTTLSRSSAGVIAVEGVVVPTISSTNTFTNKRITKRTGTTTSSATPTINTDNVDEYYITAQAVDITSFTTNLTGTPTQGQLLFISVIGTAARAITWGASFGNGPVALPTTTVTTTELSVLFKYDGSIWRCYASGSRQ